MKMPVWETIVLDFLGSGKIVYVLSVRFSSRGLSEIRNSIRHKLKNPGWHLDSPDSTDLMTVTSGRSDNMAVIILKPDKERGPLRSEISRSGAG